MPSTQPLFVKGLTAIKSDYPTVFLPYSLALIEFRQNCSLLLPSISSLKQTLYVLTRSHLYPQNNANVIKKTSDAI